GRFTLWNNAWVIIKESPIIGFGPGAFSGLDGMGEGLEAHNSLIDWTISTGFIGAAMLIALCLYAAWFCIRAQNYALLFLLLSVGAFSMAHNVVRQPIVWVYLVLTIRICSDECRASNQTSSLSA